ncbi:cryptochrome/photolyase family protein [Aestuariibacter sp. AA17]|uniref:Cryptochrome/photolyase family protein n=1 Tax=Fluctibacter corallii TaxID=2984329 RepID=A0ABT3A3W0_9ALTE|nr:cryptochrome/photolyase family protein [Aestuariibacter sp. AA17]MCV2883360.1 cryptochrome/photolyase family protein [Aestuariibacter sp. AA17]
MKTLRLILGDQLSTDISSLQDIDKHSDIVLMAEVREEATYVKHHKKKIAFLFSAMRHFAKQLNSDGINVLYIDYEHPENQGSLFEQIKYFCQSENVARIVVTKPGEYRLLDDMQQWQARLNIDVELREDNRFLSTPEDFALWAKGRKQLRMEYFYREMRQRWHILMDGKDPVGGKWNYDAANRQSLPDNITIPSPTRFDPDALTKNVITLVETHFSDHFGSLQDFHFAVTRKQALTVLAAFIDERLAQFGDYQDAMANNKPWLFHSHISFYLNCGLLTPKEVINKAQEAYDNHQAPLNAVEGFIRQVLGWREYVRGLYWYKMPEYKTQNYLNATRSLPDFFWDTNTKMQCLKQCLSDTYNNAYAHHIQRLMVIGNFALLAGLAPDEVNNWYLLVYADAYEWVELPNVTGMILFADGGVLASKPYAASGNYIHKMSDYCQHCHYNVKEKNGSQACPFNYLYWDFLIRNQDKLGRNPRLGMPYKTLTKMTADKQRLIQEDAEAFFTKLHNHEEV